jgi:uncharacterized protein
MKISFDRLKREQKIFLDKETINFEDIDLRKDFCGKIIISLTLSLLKSKVPMIELRGNLDGEVNLICDRCAETFSKKINYKIDEVYELDKEEISKKVIYIDTKVKDFILNSFPMKILCKEDCKGICIQCNTNLNKENCKCKQL